MTSEKLTAFEECACVLIDRYKANRDHKDCRPIVVVVLGAAASHPLVTTEWREMKKPILDRCELEGEFVIRELVEQLSYIVGTPKDEENKDDLKKRMEEASVEEICNGIKTFKTLLPIIQELIAEKFNPERESDKAGLPPLLAYEILAHLLNHGFIDHIISFNFDQLLDRAINSELGDSKCELIISENQLVKPIVNLDIPRVIKIHGSVSSPSTLRFTLDDTRALTIRMREYLDDLIFSNNNRRVSIISYGYSWNDKNLSDWLKNREDKIDHIYISRLCSDPPETLVSQPRTSETEPISRSNALLDKIKILSTNALFDYDKTPKELCTVSTLLAATWRYMANRMSDCNNSVSFQTASRHFICGEIFRLKKENTNIPVVAHDHENRMKLETYLHLLKCKGMINVPALSADHRIQPYYKDYLADERKCGVIHNEFMLDRFRFMKKSDDDDLKEVYFATQKDPTELINDFFKTIAMECSEPVLVFEYDKKTSKILCCEQGETPKEYFSKHLKKIYEASEVEVSSKTDPRDLWSFHHSIPLTSQMALKDHSKNLLEEYEWTHLLVIAETGEWLYKEHNFQEGDWVGVITACIDNPQSWPIGEKIRSKLRNKRDVLPQQGIDINEVQMRWFHHNRHLTLAIDCKENNDTLESLLKGGVFFRRYNMAKSIRPVWLSDTRDLLELFVTYLAYFRRTLDVNENSFDDKNKHFTELDYLADRIIKILGEKPTTNQQSGDYKNRIKTTIDNIRENIKL